jgi:hypothetical protein
MSKVSKDMQNAIPRSFDMDAELNTSFNGRTGRGASGQVYHQNISITSPKALSEREAAREFRNLSRKLAMGTA